MMRYPEVYDHDLKRVAILQNAFKIGYEQKFNALWTAHFSLPLDDPKREYCKPMHFVEIFDGDERVDLFRIIPSGIVKDDSGGIVTYRLEHVLGTLLDDIMFQYHQIGGTGVYTDEVLQYILSHQETGRWQLGTVDFSRQFQYNWENENLLAALFSVPKPFLEEHQWTWDTTSYPWTLNLVQPSDKVKSYIYYRKNMRGIEKEEDPTELCTRLYALGYGEGVNQLGISGVNPTGKPYIDSDTQNQFGIISRVWVDRRYESEETLFNAAKAMLEELKMPRVSYSVDAVELFQLTGDSVDKFVSGDVCRVTDEDLGTFKARLVNVARPDVFGEPGDIQVDIANRPEDIAGSIAELADRTRINEVYAQGATNLDSQNFIDNCGPEHPAILRFWIPEETVRINKMLLTYQLESFRANSQAVEGGGSLVDTTQSGGAATTTSDGGGEHRHQMFKYVGGLWDEWDPMNTGSGDGNTGYSGSHSHYDLNQPHDHNTGYDYYSDISTGGNHRHTLGGHTHQYNYPFYVMRALHSSSGSDWWNVGLAVPKGYNRDLWTWGSSGSHNHIVSIPNHQHGITLPNHTHQIKYGIYQGPVPDEVTIEVDGNEIPGLGIAESDVDIVPYLAKDSGGKVLRGWHEITITPDKLGRIMANIVSQFFVQSRGGGDY